MSISVNTIKRLLALLLGVFVVTYLISLNMENHFIVTNTKWFSNDFLFAIAGGAFASFFVVFICEIIRYYQIKKATEGTLFANLANLYSQVLIIRGNCLRSLNDNDIVPDNLIQPICDNSIMLADFINGIDYTPFCGKSKIKDVLTKFKTEKYLVLKNVLISFRFFRIAILEEKRNLLQKGKSENVTSDCPFARDALNKVISQTSTILTPLDQIISQIDNELQNKYNWQNLKQVLNVYQDNYEAKTLRDYMNEDVIVF